MTSRVPRVSRRHSGVALVMVLLMVVLLSLLVVSFFIDVRTEAVSAANYSERSKVKMFADSVENLVVAQIQKATEGVDGSGGILAWASQPGMIRTWDDRGNPARAYKLYSSDQMVVDGNFGSEDAIAADIPSDWKSRPAEFTDLNSPVLVEDPDGSISKDGRKYAARFPVISGNNLEPGQYAGRAVQTYEAEIEGFGVEGQPQISDDSIRPDNNPIPMPVRWLYILEDGSLAPIGGGGGAGASSENPIVGRVAFWADDDTCKLNINTASEGVFWDRPYNGSMTERMFGNNIPAQNEFSTFPGHPATTSLSPVLGSILPVPDWITAGNYSQLVPYYDLIPRVKDGGSKGGTFRASTTSHVVNYDADRLYASVDEFIFQAEAGGNAREKNAPAITNDFLEQARFFLTAHSRAPDVNLFNRPRVALWPLDPNVQNAKDKLIAYCSTINGRPFHFSRTVVSGRTPEASAFRSTSQSSTADWDKFLRNKQLYNYLQRLTDAPIPGLGGRLARKYPGNLRDQILTEMADFVRAGVNISSSELEPVYHFAPPKGVHGQGQVVPLTLARDGSSGRDTRGFGRFLTVSEGTLILYNATPTPGASDANLIGAVFVLEAFCPSPGLPSWSPNVKIKVKGLDGFHLGGHPLNFPSEATNVCNALEMAYNGSFPATSPSGSTAFPATRSMLYYSTTANTRRPKTVQGQDGEAPASIYPFASKTLVDIGQAVPMNTDDTNRVLELRGATVEVEVYGPYDSAPIQRLKLDFANGAHQIQGRDQRDVVNVPVPEPDPALGQQNLTANPISANATFSNRIPKMTDTWDIKDRLILRERTRANVVSKVVAANQKDRNNNFRTANKEFNRRGDVVRSVEASVDGPLYGDLRALSLVFDDTTSSGNPLFARHPFYDAADRGPTERLVKEFATFDPIWRLNTTEGPSLRKYNYRFAEGLRNDENVYNGQFGGYFHDDDYRHAHIGKRKGTFIVGGSLVKLTTGRWIQRDAIPSVPFTLNGSWLGGEQGRYGDWDTGLGICSDGPYINFPDQANSSIRVLTGLQAGGGEQIFGGYFGRGEFDTTSNYGTAAATFSPNRQIASAVTFGSLPAGVDPKNPANLQAWRTLLFCANPAAGANHPGFGKSVDGSNPYPPYAESEPPDHAFLDLFTMPIVEGYPISEPMSTAGKVNMNYQIAPFTYIRRSTGIRGVLKNVRLAALPTNAPYEGDDDDAYKSAAPDRQGWTRQMRYGIELDEQDGTLRQFEQRFEKGDLFRSATEICDMLLVPRRIFGISQDYPPGQPPKFSGGSGEIQFSGNPVANWWNGFIATGDNLRETPYNHIYPRLTTKSNSYTVHVRVQTLAKNPATSAGTFVDPSSSSGRTDSITGEYRGSFQVERYLDPNELERSGIDFATAGLSESAATLGDYYKYRTISTKEFKP